MIWKDIKKLYTICNTSTAAAAVAVYAAAVCYATAHAFSTSIPNDCLGSNIVWKNYMGQEIIATVPCTKTKNNQNKHSGNS